MLQVPLQKQVLKKPTDETCKQWETLDDRKTLGECGFSSSNARAQSPALVALVIPSGIHRETCA